MGAVFEKKFEQYFLSDQKVDELIEKGLLSSGIKQPRLKKNWEGEYVREGTDSIETGVKAAFIRSDIVYDWFYLTDFHFIYVEPNRSSRTTFKKDKSVKFTYMRPDVIHVIPLELIDEIEIAYGETYNWIEESKTVEKEKNVIAGAAVGAVVAGPVGAVVGSIANSGTKKITTPTMYHENTTYNLNICIDGEGYSVDNWYNEYNTTSDRKKEAFNNKRTYLNEEAKRLIARAKEDMSEEEKIKIVKETMMTKKKEKTENNVKGIISIIFIIVIVALWVFIING